MDTYDQDDADDQDDDDDDVELTPEELKLFGFLCRAFLKMPPDVQERFIRNMDPVDVLFEKIRHFKERN